MNFGSSFSRNEVVDPIGANWVRNEHIASTFSDGDSSHPSNASSANTPTKITLPQFFAKSTDHVSGKALKTKDVKTNPTVVTAEDKPSPKVIASSSQRRCLDPPGVLAEEQVEKQRKTARRKKSKSSNNKEGSSRTRSKDERRSKKEGRHKQPLAVECSCDETTVSWTRTPEVIPDVRYTTADAFHQSRRASNDGQLLRLKATKSKRNLGYNFEASMADVTSTTTKTTSSEISELVRRIQANPKSPNPRRIRNDRRSIQSQKRLSRGLDRKASSTKLTMVASPTKVRKGNANTIGRKNAMTIANQNVEQQPDSPVKETRKIERRHSVAPLDFSEFENEDFSAGDGVAAIVVETTS